MRSRKGSYPIKQETENATGIEHTNTSYMNVLSLFDGMSCGQIALREAGIHVSNYYASEIDRYAIAQTQLNFPNTIQLGSVTDVRGADLPKIDLLIGGSPCQGFSYSGKRLNFNDPRSKLFFEYVRILKELREKNPDVLFLLENVRMKREYEWVISEQLGLEPVMINSALVSAQHRIRLYWTNIRTKKVGLFGDVVTDIPQPQDKGLLLCDVIDAEVNEKYYVSEKTLENLKKHKERNKAAGNGFGIEIRQPQDKGATLTVGGRGFRDLVEVAVYQRPRGENKGGYFTDKTPTLTANSWENNNLLEQRSITHTHTRRLTPTECSRLQTIPSWYNWDCSETQQYKMLGNGWTVDVIKYIFSFINVSK